MGRKRRNLEDYGVDVREIAVDIGTTTHGQLRNILLRYEGLSKRQARSAVELYYHEFSGFVEEMELPGKPPLAAQPVFLIRLDAWLSQILQECPHFAEAVARTGDSSRVIVYHDECQGGNPLSPNPSFKAHCIYLSWHAFPPEFLRSPQYWLPIGFLDHNHAGRIQGGVSAYIQLILKQFQEGIFLRPQGTKLALHAWVGDYEAHRATYSCKGSAALLPCLWCSNVVAKGSGLVEHGHAHGVVDISCGDPALFHHREDAELFALADALAVAKPHLSKAAFDFKCKASGLTFEPGGILWNVSVRQELPPSRTLSASRMVRGFVF